MRRVMVVIFLFLPVALGAQVIPTNEWVSFWSDSSVVNSSLINPGAVVRAYDPEGTLCGEFTVTTTGSYGLMAVYRDDLKTELDEGAEPGDTISFSIDGVPVSAGGPDIPVWSANGDVKRVNLIREQVIPTNEWVSFWGDNCVVNGFDVPVPVGAVVRAYDPQGTLCGQFTVTTEGTYGLMPVYRDDSTTEIDEGADPGDTISFSVNNVPVDSVTGPDSPAWTSNGDIKKVNLNAARETATLLQSYFASLEGAGVAIDWRLSEVSKVVEFYVLRAEVPGGRYRELPGSGIKREGLYFSYRDGSCEPGVTYRYRIDVRDEEGRRVLFETEDIEIPTMLINLYQNHPNPFNPATTISYYLPVEGRVTLDVYDVSGRLVDCLVDEYHTRGRHTVEWRGKNDLGIDVASGVYFYRLRFGKSCITRKMALLK